MVIEMKTINRIISITHIASIVACVYLGVYSIQQPIETNDLLFQISLTDGLILSIFLFATIFIGNIFGAKYKTKAEIAGGIILILIGIKVVIEHYL